MAKRTNLITIDNNSSMLRRPAAWEARDGRRRPVSDGVDVDPEPLRPERL
jgi:hypothetical protein